MLFTEAVQMIEKVDREKQMPAVLQSGMSALAEIEMAEEVGYRLCIGCFQCCLQQSFKSGPDRVELGSEGIDRLAASCSEVGIKQ